MVGIEHLSGSWGEATFLNLGLDYPDPDRFTIVIWESDPSFDEIFSGERVCGSGDVSLYEGVLQMELESLTNVRVPSLEEVPEPDYPGPY